MFSYLVNNISAESKPLCRGRLPTKKKKKKAAKMTLHRIYIRENAGTKGVLRPRTSRKSPTFVKSRWKREEKENSRQRAAASVRHVGHLLQNGSARQLHLQRDSLNEMRTRREVLASTQPPGPCCLTWTRLYNLFLIFKACVSM